MRIKLVLLFLLFAGVAAADEADTRKRILLIGQEKDKHPPATHEYIAGTLVMQRCLRQHPRLDLQVVQANGAWPEGNDLLADADAAVLFVAQGAQWLHEQPRRIEAFTKFAQRGGGLVCLHWAMGTKPAEYIEPFRSLFGGCHGGPDRRYEILKSTVVLADAGHPTVRGIQPFEVKDEFYFQLKFADAKPAPQPIWRISVDGTPQTVAWAWERPDGGRSFGFSGLHFHSN